MKDINFDYAKTTPISTKKPGKLEIFLRQMTYFFRKVLKMTKNYSFSIVIKYIKYYYSFRVKIITIIFGRKIK